MCDPADYTCQLFQLLNSYQFVELFIVSFFLAGISSGNRP